MKKETKIEIFFWLVVLLVFSPRILLEVYEKKLRDNLTPFENNEWTVKDKNGNVIYDKLELPYDLRWKEQKTNRREWIFEKEIGADQLRNFEDLGIVLGRIGDSDYVMFNDCMIGSMGFNTIAKKVNGWGWLQLRRYQVDRSCIKYPISKIIIHVYKNFGPGYGLFIGPIGYGDFFIINEITKVIDFFKGIMPTVFGLGLIFFIGFHYLFIFLFAEKREIYGIFAALSISVGVYLFIIGLIPFSFEVIVLITMKLLFLSAFSASTLFLVFFNRKFNFPTKKLINFYLIVSSPLVLISFFQNKSQNVYNFYEAWHPLFLISFFIGYAQIWNLKSKGKNDIYFNKYFLAYSIFIFCCLHDVAVSVFSLSNSYLVAYGFTFFVLVIAMNLSREYSDAFVRVEDQVVERTKELKFALTEIQEIQILKDDQARSFAHDIRSPLVALQVLKENVSRQLSDDQRSLLKHTIIRINDLANTILPKTILHTNGHLQSIFIWGVVDKLLSEKRVEYQEIQDCSFEIQTLSPVLDLYVFANEVEFTRILSNLINNSVEARQLYRNLQITISLEKIESSIYIKIQDNGKGIDPGYISKVFDSGFTHGKSGGMGVGLSHAKKLLEQWKGHISVQSQLGQGTCITIELPATTKPAWMKTFLDLRNIENLVIIDDQAYVIDVWKQKLQTLSKKFEIFWVKNMDDWKRNPLHDLSKDRSMFLVDYDLSSDLTGIDLIQQLKLFPHLCLVTANEDDLDLREKAIELGITIMPKSIIHNIEIFT